MKLKMYWRRKSGKSETMNLAATFDFGFQYWLKFTTQLWSLCCGLSMLI